MFRMNSDLRISYAGTGIVADRNAQQREFVDKRSGAGRGDDGKSSQRCIGLRAIHDTMAMVCARTVRGRVQETWLAPSYVKAFARCE